MFIKGKLGAGKFLERPNRFLVVLDTLEGRRRCHVRDPGRLTELLVKGAPVVFLERSNPGRKTDCEVLLVWDGKVWTVVNSGLHSELATELLASGFLPELRGFTSMRREVKYGNSRVDFMLEYPGKVLYLEVKGCTLVGDGVALFPDAPTERGRRHVLNLIRAVDEGHDAAILFLVMRPDAELLIPNAETDPGFAEALREAENRGVRMFAVTFRYLARRIEPLARIPLIATPQ